MGKEALRAWRERRQALSPATGCNRLRVLATYDANPEWNSEQIARALKCCAGYVRATLYRSGLPVVRTVHEEEKRRVG